MAWQLIYSSAPRLLEAGRSGFGTVARHRQINPLLVAAIERASQFARGPGLHAERVIYSHRILTLATGRFHVLSSIRDAGADYTGRTNHLAHHVIAEPREVAGLRISPADALLAFPWLSSWEEPPRHLEGADEIDLSALSSQTDASGAAWARLTGKAQNAWLLAAGEGSRSACILTPVGLDLRPLYGEALRLMPERLWQVPFTTSFQSSDEAAEFHWLGAEADSPSRDSLLTTSRAKIDLTAPGALPLPEIPRSSVPSSNAPAAAAVAVPKVVASAGVKVAGAGRAVPVGKAAGDPFGTYQPARPKGRKGVVLGGVAVGLLALLGVGGKYYLGQQEQKKSVEEIATAAQRGGYYSEKTSEQLRTKLASLPEEKFPKVRELAEAAAQLASARSLEPYRRTPALPALQARAKAAEVNLPEEIGTLAAQVDALAAEEAWLQAFRPQAESYAVHDELRRRAQGLPKLTAKLPSGLTEAAAGVEKLATRQQALSLETMLNGRVAPTQKIGWFREAMTGLNSPANEDETRQRLQKTEQLLEDWKGASEMAPEVVEKQVAARREGWPIWLAKLAAERAGGPRTAKATAPTTGPTMENGAGRISQTGRTTLYYVENREQLARLEVKELTPALNFEIRRPTGEVVKFGFKHEHTVRRNVQSANDGFQIIGNKLAPEPNAPEPPYVFVGRDPQADAKEVLRVYVGFPIEREKFVTKEQLTLERHGEKVKLTGPLPNFGESLEASYALLAPPLAAGGKPTDLPLDAQGEGSLQAALKDGQKRIVEKRMEADKWAQQASELLAGGKNLEVLRAKVAKAHEGLKKEFAKKAVDLKAGTPAALVGDYAKALSYEWEPEPKPVKEKDKEKEKEAKESLKLIVREDPKEILLDSLKAAGRNLGDAQGDVPQATAANKALVELLPKLSEKFRSSEYEKGVSNLRSLTNLLSAQLGDSHSLEAEATRLNEAAQSAEKEAKQMEEAPLLKGEMPPGEYTLVARLKQIADVKLLTFTVPAK